MCFFDFDYRNYNNSYYYDVYTGSCEPCPGETDQDCFDRFMTTEIEFNGIRFNTTDFGTDECLLVCVPPIE